MIDAKTLRLIAQSGLQNFAAGRILDGIAALRTLLPYCAAETVLHAEAESLEENYHHMLSFLRQGGNDEKRGEVQEKIQRQGVALLEQASRAIRIALNKDRYCGARKTVSLDDDVLETDERQDDIFDMLWTSPIWSAQDTALWYDFILRQRDMVQQHLTGALFLSVWEHYDAEKIQLLNLLAESECHRTHIMAVAYLLLLRIRHKELLPLMPPLPAGLLTKKGRKFIAQVEYEFMLMLISEKDMEKELKEAESFTNNVLSSLSPTSPKGEGERSQWFTPPFEGKGEALTDSLKSIISLRGRYLKNRLQRGLDINLSKIALLHSCDYMHRVSHWFLPFDKTHPLFQSVMIDENGNEKQTLSTLVDLIMDCDVDKLAMLWLVANDKDFSKAVKQLDNQELPDIENAVIPEYTFRFIMQDLYRFFCHSPLSSQLLNPFKREETLLSFPEIAKLFSIEDTVSCCNLLHETGRDKQALTALDDAIRREGASAAALLLKAQVLLQQKKFGEAISCARNAEMLEPENTDILGFIAECYGLLNRHEEVLEYLQRLAELMPEDKRIRMLIPLTLNRLGRNKEALQLFFKLDYETKEDDKDYRQIVSSIANTALHLGKLDIAERYTVKQISPQGELEGAAHLRLGHIRLLQDNRKDALNHYEQFVEAYRKAKGRDISAALSQLKTDWKMLVSKGIKESDLLLLHDILQASANGSARQNPPRPTAE